MTKLLSKTVLALGLLVLSLSCNAQQIRFFRFLNGKEG